MRRATRGIWQQKMTWWSYLILRWASVADKSIHGLQVGFRDQKAVKKVVALKSNEIVNRLNRTKREEFPNLEARKEAYDTVVSPTVSHLEPSWGNISGNLSARPVRRADRNVRL